MRKTKIVCTLGPANDDIEVLKQLVLSGMNVARFNFSHSTHDEHKHKLDMIKQVRNELNMPIATMLDTKGPEIRLGLFNQPSELKQNDTFVIVNQDIVGDNTKASVNYKELYNDLHIGDTLLFDDGLIELTVTDIKDKDIYCKIQNDGIISNNKSINVPNVRLHLPSLTTRDIDDILFGIENNFDFIAASFVRRPDDILQIKNILQEHNATHIKVIAKIENKEGLDNFDEILKIADGIMVARGDLGVEMPMEQIPIIQKSLIKKCYMSGKPVITATQMLESMITNPRPTRAEVSDVANAIYDGTSSIMLSGESAVGKHPCQCVTTMVDICLAIENKIPYWDDFNHRVEEIGKNDKEIINYASCLTAMHLDTKAILAFTLSGETARILSRFRPQIPIYAITPDETAYNQLSLSWGVTPIHIPGIYSLDDAVDVGIQKCIDLGLIEKGDLVVISGGYNDSSEKEEKYRLNKVLGGILRI